MFLAILLVLAIAAAVAFVGVRLAHRPPAAARMVGVLQGECLLNDALALLVFGVAINIAAAPGDPCSHVMPRL